MRKNRNLYQILPIAVLFTLLHTVSFAQTLQNYSDLPDDEVIGFLLPSNWFDVTNIQVKGLSKQRGGIIVPANDIGIVYGILLTTGDANLSAVGPNLTPDASVVIGDTTTDYDLQMLLPRAKQYDVAIIECDFSTDDTIISFNIALGSEEHCGYERTGFNDIVGVFLSGTGINGPYSNGAINLAALPNNSPLCVETINLDNNPQRYLPNPPPSYPDCGAEAAQSTHQLLGYNGISHPILAEQKIMPKATYHLKIAIADIRDGLNDSGLFISSNLQAHTNELADCTPLLGPVRIFPSPATNVVNVFSLLPELTTLTQLSLIDNYGRLLQNIQINPTNEPFIRTFDTQNLPAGSYFVRLRNVNTNFICPIIKL